jgi:predicted transcriptional regulator YdeE
MKTVWPLQILAIYGEDLSRRIFWRQFQIRLKSLSTIPKAMVWKSIDGGNYLKLTAKGNLMNGLIVNKWQEIWKLDLNRVFTADFEVFGEKALDPPHAEIDFFIAVK